jgi:ABC-type transport system involved in multi-copper enzyme maturation permease subunit
MIRVTGTQPVSRCEFALGRSLALSAYIVLFTFAFIATQLAWAAVYTGVDSIRADLAAILRFSTELFAFVLALGWMAMAVSSLRRTVGGGIVNAYLLVIGLALMTMLPFDRVPPRLVFMRYFFFAHQELTDPFARFGYHDCPLVRVFTRSDFWLAVTVTPVMFVMPALLRFHRRDISE